MLALGGRGAAGLEWDVYEELILAAMILAIPVVLFLLFELFFIARSWRNRALATRRKGPGPR